MINIGSSGGLLCLNYLFIFPEIHILLDSCVLQINNIQEQIKIF